MASSVADTDPEHDSRHQHVVVNRVSGGRLGHG